MGRTSFNRVSIVLLFLKQFCFFGVLPSCLNVSVQANLCPFQITVGDCWASRQTRLQRALWVPLCMPVLVLSVCPSPQTALILATTRWWQVRACLTEGLLCAGQWASASSLLSHPALCLQWAAPVLLHRHSSSARSLLSDNSFFFFCFVFFFENQWKIMSARWL